MKGKNNLELINWLERGHFRIPFLKTLSDQPKHPSDLAEKFEINRVSVSRILKDLKEKKLVDCTEVRARSKLYFITSRGDKILNILSNMGFMEV